MALMFPTLQPGSRRADHRMLVGIAVAVGLIVATTSPATIVSAIGAVAFVLFLLHRPHWGLYFIILSVPVQTMYSLKVGPMNFSSTEVLVILTSLSWIGQILLLGVTRLERAPLLAPMLVLLGAIFLSFLQAQELVLSIKELVKWLELFMVYLLSVNLLRTRDHVAIAVLLLIIAALLQAGIGLDQFLNRQGPASFLIRGQFLRAYGTFDQPNPFAGYLNLVTPLCIALFLVTVRGVSTAILPNVAVRTEQRAWLAATLIITAGVIASLSRGAWLALAVATFVLAFRAGRAPWKTIGILACLYIAVAWCAAIGLLPTSLWESLLKSFSLAGVDTDVTHLSPETFSAAQRLAFWTAGLNMFQDNTWFGVGMGNYGVFYNKYAVRGWQADLAHAHDYYLNFAAETGLIGLCAFLYFTCAVFYQTWRPAFRLKDPLFGAIAAGALGMFIGLCVHNVFDDLFVHGTVNVIAIILGLSAVVERLDDAASLVHPELATGATARRATTNDETESQGVFCGKRT